MSKALPHCCWCADLLTLIGTTSEAKQGGREGGDETRPAHACSTVILSIRDSVSSPRHTGHVTSAESFLQHNRHVSEAGVIKARSPAQPPHNPAEIPSPTSLTSVSQSWIRHPLLCHSFVEFEPWSAVAPRYLRKGNELIIFVVREVAMVRKAATAAQKRCWMANPNQPPPRNPPPPVVVNTPVPHPPPPHNHHGHPNLAARANAAAFNQHSYHLL